MLLYDFIVLVGDKSVDNLPGVSFAISKNYSVWINS